MPPASVILALAVSVNLRAATVILGTLSTLLSSVTVPTTTAVLFLRYALEGKEVLLVSKVLNEFGDGNRGSVNS